MITRMYSVYDSAVGAYMPPFFSRANGEALRSFIEACNDPKRGFVTNPGDYTLFFLGSFDDASASFVIPDAPERLMSALDAIRDTSGDFTR